MMTTENIKEAISLRYIELIAAFEGYKTNSVYPDNGTDLSIIEVKLEPDENGRKRYRDTGRELKIQLKATTENSVTNEDSFIKYDIEAKTYNDLINRIKNNHPLILILFILPTKSSDWINISDKKLIAKKCAYWYVPNQHNKETKNKSSVRIKINKKNIILKETLNLMFEKFGI